MRLGYGTDATPRIIWHGIWFQIMALGQRIIETMGTIFAPLVLRVKETYISAKAACTAADLTLMATRGLRAATADSKGSREGVSYGKMRNSLTARGE